MTVFYMLRRVLEKTKSKHRVTVIAFLLLLFLLLTSTLGFWQFERGQDLTLMDSFWLSFVTMTTVGYGDITPQTPAGRLLGIVVTMTGGIGVMAYLITLIASAIIDAESKRMKGLLPVTCTDHILIINCPNEDKVLTLVEEIRLDAKTADTEIVLITDDLDECPASFEDLRNFHFVRGNPVLRRVLETANAGRAAKAIILARDTKDPHSDGLTTQMALTLENLHKELGQDIYTVAEAVSRDSITPMKAAGVEEVICVETLISPILVQALLDPGIADVISELTSNRTGSQYYVEDVSFAEGTAYHVIREYFQGHDHLRIVPVALASGGKSIINPSGSRTIRSGDKLIYIADQRYSLQSVLPHFASG